MRSGDEGGKLPERSALGGIDEPRSVGQSLELGEHATLVQSEAACEPAATGAGGKRDWRDRGRGSGERALGTRGAGLVEHGDSRGRIAGFAWEPNRPEFARTDPEPA